MSALLGIALATVTPQPAYSPLTPCAAYIALNVPTNVAPGSPRAGVAPPLSAVCIAGFAVSTGKSARDAASL
ncbi:hypothetical protein FOMPIDRAFT_1024820 [Fomitopsis schrenkii]|uniref:Uncharacterized protein n=1 Tax=Fomitopsis schrenkii TaxID=2126942 RepID=S8DY67_FOMSC|nr:hypothetical protein FOMPIDRAFT_1024820 [Fomitopsis schrenkii]